MANEFIARNGLISQNNSLITGSLTVTNGITGSLFGTSSWAHSASFAVTASYFAGSVDDLGVSPLVVAAATTTILPNTPVYSNGTAGVGAFISGSTNGALTTIDGVTLSLSDRILVKNQTLQLQNGVYELTQSGSASSKYILTRTTDSDQTADFDPQVVIPSLGNVNKGLLFAQNTNNPIVGTNNIVYIQTTTTTYVTQTTTGTQTLYNIPWWIATARQLSRGVSNLQFNSVTNTLLVTGSIIANSVTSSLFGTASWSSNAVTASYVLQSVSASFAATASSVNTLNQNVIVNGAVTASQMLITGSGGNINRLSVVGSGSNTPIFTVQGSQGNLFSINDTLSGSLFSVNDISALPILEVFSDNRILLGSFASRALITTTKTNITSTGAFTVYSLPTSSYDGAFYEYTLKSGVNARAGQISAIWIGTSVKYTEVTTMDFGDTSGVSLGVFISGSNLILTGSAGTSGWVLKTIIRSV